MLCINRMGIAVVVCIALTVASSAHADLGDQLFKLLADDGVVNDQFGKSVAISGATAIVGAWHDGANFGSAYLFASTTGLQIAKLLADDGEAFDTFGISVAISGAPGKELAIVGAPEHDDNGSNSGAAYLFDTTTGQQIAKLLPDDGEASDNFGISVAISGAPGKEIAIVGAYEDDDNGGDSGSAYLFDISVPASPIQIAKLLPDDGEPGDEFGWSVAISGAPGKEIAIVGAYFDDDNGASSGSAYLFDATTGVQIAKLLPDDGSGGDRFGYSVALSGATAIVGAHLDDNNNGNAAGSAYLFDASTGVQIAKLVANDGAANDQFGISVAISESRAIVGAFGDDDNRDGSGSAYLFDNTTGCQIGKLLPDDGASFDDFGQSVAISGAPGKELAIVGAWLDDDNGLQSGSAYLFDAAGTSPCPWDIDGNGSVGTSDLILMLGAWGACDDPCCPADFNEDGNVGTSDLIELLGNWGPCPK